MGVETKEAPEEVKEGKEESRMARMSCWERGLFSLIVTFSHLMNKEEKKRNEKDRKEMME